MKIIKKQKINKPNAMNIIIAMPEFIESGVTEDELSISVSKEFEAERKKIVEDMRKALNKLRNSN